MYYLLCRGSIGEGAGAKEIVDICERVRWCDSVYFPVERVAYDCPDHGCHGYSEAAREHYHQ